MSAKSETNYIATIHRFIKRDYGSLAFHMEKMNNPYRRGTFDMWYSGEKDDLWVEYKYLPKLPTKPTMPGLSDLQIKWGKERFEEGRNVAVVVGVGPHYNHGVVLRHPETWSMELHPDIWETSLVPTLSISGWIAEQVMECWVNSYKIVEKRLVLANALGDSSHAYPKSHGQSVGSPSHRRR